jgi:hypothetical protein
VPLIKISELLKQASILAENGDWDALSGTCRQISNQNAAKQNLFAAASYLDGKASRYDKVRQTT